MPRQGCRVGAPRIHVAPVHSVACRAVARAQCLNKISDSNGCKQNDLACYGHCCSVYKIPRQPKKRCFSVPQRSITDIQITRGTPRVMNILF
jgi:hypothetical protein